MKKITFLFVLFFVTFYSNAQIKNVNPNPNGDPWILGGYREPSKEELERIPKLFIEDKFKTRNLPSSLDNSTKQYFRPVFNQTDGCCAQASGVAYNFTYEVNRAKGTSANTPENQFPTHFTYNFLNSGSGDNGSWYGDGWQIIKANGCPSVATYGGLYQDPKFWMSGYSNYETGMQYRVDEIFNIDVSTPQGLETMKYWMYNHADGSSTGGIVNFAAGISTGNYEITNDNIITSWGADVNHAMTFVGWDDNLGYDYNGDGQITNNIDQNGDGIVDMKDWEKGAVIMVNSWGTYWGNNGRAYVPYRLLALTPSLGGIGAGNMVSSIKIKNSYSPTLILKTKIQHNKRNKIKIIPGVSSNINASLPEHTLDIPLFDYQGGAYDMQGTNSNPIEISLDITPLLNYVTSGTQAKFFLQVIENDPYSSGSGTIQSMSVKTNEGNEYTCSQTNVTIANNSTTTISVVATPIFQAPTILNNQLPDASINQQYSETLIGQNGTEPYKWHLLINTNQSVTSGSFPNISSNYLTPSDNDDGFAAKTIDFDFPFYDNTYKNIYIRTDGSIAFEPGFSYIRTNDAIIQNKVISIFASDLMIYPSDGDGIFYEGNQNYATFRWKTSLYNQQSAYIDVAITLYPNGDIKFFYNSNITPDLDWAAGISNGDGYNYLISNNSGTSNPSSQKFIFQTSGCPLGMSLDINGNFFGTPQQTGSYNINVLVIDNNNLSNSKIIPFEVKEPNALYNKNNEFQIFPNPANEFITIFSNLSSFETIEIVDINGKIIYSNYFSNSKSSIIDIRTYPKGIYFIKIYSKSTLKIQKLIVN